MKSDGTIASGRIHDASLKYCIYEQFLEKINIIVPDICEYVII
jgi:hypothetical protein